MQRIKYTQAGQQFAPGRHIKYNNIMQDNNVNNATIILYIPVKSFLWLRVRWIRNTEPYHYRRRKIIAYWKRRWKIGIHIARNKRSETTGAIL